MSSPASVEQTPNGVQKSDALLNGAAQNKLELNDLIGEWHSSDQAFGEQARSKLRWHKTLNDTFYQLHYQIDQRNIELYVPFFSATALYTPNDANDYVATWADSSGRILSVEAKITGQTLESVWSGTQGVEGKTHYTLVDENTLLVKDWTRTDSEWNLFNEQRYTRDLAQPSRVTGIGGFFFRGKEPAKLVAWYDQHFDITPTPSDYDTLPWQQEAGSTVFAPFNENTSYFGEPSQQWMINLRVRDMDAVVKQLRDAGIEVELDPETYPNGRFARLSDPEGNPIQLWEAID